MKTRIFIGSSSEAVRVAEEIQLNLSSFASVSTWQDNIFTLSEYTCEALFNQLDRVDYAVFVLSADDFIETRSRTGKSPRDNVVFELGLFAGRLGLKKVFVVHPDDREMILPSDLLGITTARYESDEGTVSSSNVAPACTKIKKAIESQGLIRPVSWNEYFSLVLKVIEQVKRPAARGGFSFDTCVGVSRGGIIAADLIARHYGMNTPVICLWADLHKSYPEKNFSPPENWINRHVLAILADKRVKNILLVDDISRSGTTAKQAKDFLVHSLDHKTIRQTSLIVDTKIKDQFDFFGAAYDTSSMQLPYYDLG